MPLKFCIQQVSIQVVNDLTEKLGIQVFLHHYQLQRRPTCDGGGHSHFGGAAFVGLVRSPFSAPLSRNDLYFFVKIDGSHIQ